MRIAFLGIVIIVLWGHTIIAQEDRIPLSLKLSSIDSVSIHSEINYYIDLDIKDQKLISPDINWDYQFGHQFNGNSSKQLGKSLIAPAVLMSIGLYSGNSTNTSERMGKRTINGSIQEEFSGFQSSFDDYLQWGPIAMVYGLQTFGLKGKHSTWESTKLLIKSELLTASFVHILKSTTDNVRPDGQGEKSFPSGHTCQAFVAATFLHREYGHISPFYSIAGYAMASTVGTMRMLNQRHWFNDVTVGAAMGIAFTNLVYWHYDRRSRKKKHNVTAVPAITDKGAAVSMMVQF